MKFLEKIWKQKAYWIYENIFSSFIPATEVEFELRVQKN